MTDKKFRKRVIKGVVPGEESPLSPVSVVMPAFNEQGSVASQIRSVKEVLDAARIPHEIIVVDDGSEDGTSEEAASAGARVITHQGNHGYGASLKTGIRSARHERIVIIDADSTYPADQIPVMLEKLSEADMVVGARTGDEVHIPLVRRPAKKILNMLANHISGVKIPDLNSGLRAFRKGCVEQYFPILPNKFSFTTTITLALLADDYRVLYHPIDYYRRVGKSKITPRNFMDFMILVIRMAMLFQPLKIFLPAALVCGSLGMVKVVLDIIGLFKRAEVFSWMLIFQPALSTSAILLLLVALQLLLIGMVADGLGRRIDRNNLSLVESKAARTFDPPAGGDEKDGGASSGAKD